MNTDSEDLFNLIIALLRKSGSQGLSKTQLIKLVFFSDLEAARNNQPMITKCNYHTHHHGIVSYAVWDATIQMSHDGNIIAREEDSYKGTPTFNVSIINDIFPKTPSSIQHIVDIVWDKYGHLNASELGIESKKLVPMDDEWENNIPVDPRDIAYEETDNFQKGCKSAIHNYPEGHTKAKPIEEYLRKLKVED